MVKKLLSITGLIIAVLLLAFACWAVGFYYAWDENTWIWMTLSILVGVFLAVTIFRIWKKWRIRKNMAEPASISVVEDDFLHQDWQAGINTLRKSSLSRISSPFYALPWFLLIGQEASKTANLLKNLSTSEAITHGNLGQASLRWWPLKTCVLIEPLEKQNLSNDLTYWSRLLKLMFKTRRREPLNGIVISLDVAFLKDSKSEQLSQYGLKLRQNINQITDLYGVRVPVYIVITGLEKLSGFSLWQECLPKGLMQQPMGYSLQGAELEIDDFIQTALDSIKIRLLNLRLVQRTENQTRIEAINTPNHLASLEKPLKHIFSSAFSVNPYAETPLLKSLYFALNTDNGERQGASNQSYFSHELFSDVLPKHRFTWQGVRFTKQWKRLLRHALVLLWFIICVMAGTILYSSAGIAEKQINALAVNSGAYNDSLNNDASTLFKFKTNIEHFVEQRTSTTRWLPFQNILTKTETQLKERLNADFLLQIMEKKINPLFDKSLPIAHHSEHPLLLAAWVEFLVRRINLSTEALANKDIENSPSFATSLAPLFSSASLPAPDALTAEEITNLHKTSILWLSKTQPELLLARKKQLVKILDDLKIDSRSNAWLNSWVEMQGYISSVEMKNYWKVNESDLPTKVLPSYTRDGFAAIKAFLIELNKADGSLSKNEKTFDIYREQFLNLGMQQWQIFLRDFTLGKQFLPDLQTRREVIYDITANQDPYAKIMNDFSQVGQEVDDNYRPQWLKTLLTINGALKASSTLPQTKDIISNEANKIGEKILGSLSPKTGVLGKKLTKVSQEKTIAGLLSEYRDNLQKTIAPLLEGSGNAMKATRDIWGYGHNPEIKTVPFFDALKNINDIQEKMTSQLMSGNADTILWDLVHGPLDFTLDFSARLAACEIQKEWQENIINAVEHINSKHQINSILFGENGQLAVFLKGSISDFIELNQSTYVPRIVHGQSLPLNSQFYAFLNKYQLNKAKIINQEGDSLQQKNKIETLNTENSSLEKELEKLDKIQASISLETKPVQINKGAKILPQLVTLQLQCASESYTLENFNFANKALFPWSSDTCSDTNLSIRFSNGLILKKTWSGARGFIDFLNEFSSGQRTYTGMDFPTAETQLNENNISEITLTYLQKGQGALLESLKSQESIQHKIDTNNESIQYIKDFQSGKIEDQNPEPVFLPKKIIRYCMEPEAAPTTPVTGQTITIVEDKEPQVKEEPPLTQYKIQIGIFKNSASLLKKLQANDVTATFRDVTIKNKSYEMLITKDVYSSLEQAQAAKEKIDSLLKLKNKSIILKQK